MSKLNLSKLKNIEPNKEIESQSINKNIKLSLSKNKSYDLDEIIKKKRRDNDENSILVKVDFIGDNSKSVLYHIAKLMLKEYNIPFTEVNYKEQINLIPNFINEYEKNVEKYYSIYTSELDSLKEGSISLETVLETVGFAFNNYAEYLSKKFNDKPVHYVSNTKTRAHVNIIEGTQDYESSDIPDIPENPGIIQSSINFIGSFTDIPENMEYKENDMFNIYNSNLNINSLVICKKYSRYDLTSEKSITIPKELYYKLNVPLILHIVLNRNLNPEYSIKIDIFKNNNIVLSESLHSNNTGLIDDYIILYGYNRYNHMFYDETVKINIYQDDLELIPLEFDTLELIDMTFINKNKKYIKEALETKSILPYIIFTK